ncbi:hypothetical protein R1flu_012396 [Riccia fluitans]|uniref:Beta-glucosidase n=1 Tax=Riccia fluitans TaxID=41844 RepID=A0ABD1ZCZ0_9MARC
MAITLRKLCAGCAILVVSYVALCLLFLPFLKLATVPGVWKVPGAGNDVLADFSSSISSQSCHPTSASGLCSVTGDKFFFGLATAPAHVEDSLNDTWLEFARGHDGIFPVRAWQNIPIPEERLRFWTEPEVELNLAKEAGVSVFRLGIDWGRIVTEEPIHGMDQVVDMKAVERYKEILQMVRNHGMRVMLTLFHHSIPKWAAVYGGWTQKKTIGYFRDFTRIAQLHFGEYVDYWITFNEPHIFVMLTYCTETWPPGGQPSVKDSIMCFAPFGTYGQAMAAISDAHKAAYNVLHGGDATAVVGVAHHVGVIKPYGLLDVPVVLFSRWLTEFQWIDDIQDHLDFCGINYYGQEILSTAGLMLVPDEEYSEAGRGVYPDGLYEVLVTFHNRYKKRRPNLRYIITENGIADARDIVRRPYLVEHLLALHAAIQEGVPVDGYVHWTVTDNWEWADGYCPKFGLVYADRTDNLSRHARPSYSLYQKVVKTGLVHVLQREDAWNTLQAEVKQGGIRPFCRDTDSHGRMWAESRDVPTTRKLASKDWRFGMYRNQGLITMITSCKTNHELKKVA